MQSELNAIIKAADYNYESIEKQYNNLKTQHNITNTVGWMVSALRRNYDNSNGSIVSSGTNRPYANFSQHEYDWDALELALLAQP